MINININGRDYEVPEGITVLQVCNESGINIPTLCYDERLKPGASCNMCIVEVEGQRELQASCTLKAYDGMRLQTHSDRVMAARRDVLGELLSKHPGAGLASSKGGTSRFHHYCSEYGVSIPKGLSREEESRYPVDRSNEFYYIDPNKCISCGLCIRVCDELQGRGALEIGDNGHVARKAGDETLCESCGNCLSVCPTGAIGEMSYDVEFAQIQEYGLEEETEKEQEIRRVKTTCPYCGVGCQMELKVRGQSIVGADGVNVLPNTGLLCVKGKFGYGFINHPDRLKKPLIKRNGEFVEATWEEAYSLIAMRAKEIKDKYGGSVFGGLSSARCTNEENYLFQKMMRGAFGSNNVDQCARL